MDYLLLALAIVLIIIGLIGCFIPVLPGPPLSFAGLILLHLSSYADFSRNLILILAIIAITATALDYIVPIWGTKKFGGSKYGSRGAIIGLIVGLITGGPIGIILGPFFGAFIGEMIYKNDFKYSFKAGLGSLFGFLTGIGLKLAASGLITFYFFKELF